MISRLTLGLFLVALLLPSGLSMWLSGHRDACSRYLAGDRSLAPTQMVEVGADIVAIPCEEWTPRQRPAIQILCLVELVVVIVFAIHALGDLADW